MKLRLGKELYARVKAMADKYSKSMAGIVDRADRAWDKMSNKLTEDGCSIELSNGFATSNDGGIITVKSDRDPKELRAVIDWYLLPIESAPDPEVPPISDSVLAEAKAMERSYKKLNIMTKMAECELELKELETEEQAEK